MRRLAGGPRAPGPGTAERTTVGRTPPQPTRMMLATPALTRMVWLFVATWAVLVPVLPATGQMVTIDPRIAQSVTLSSSQRAEVRLFVDALKADAFGDVPGPAKRAIDSLLSPLHSGGVSVAFRQAMSDALYDEIESAIGDDRVWIEHEGRDHTLNARPYTGLRLAGEIATDRMLGLIRQQLSNTDMGRRFFAIHATEMVFFAVQTAAPAVTKESLYAGSGTSARGIVADLAARLVEEDSSRHAAAIVRSLGEAGRISDSTMQDVASNAIRLIGDRTSDRIRARRGTNADTEERKVWITAGREVFPVIAQPAGGVDKATALAAIRLGGHLVASVYRDVEKSRDDGSEDGGGGVRAETQKQMLELAENLLTFGEMRLADALSRSPDKRFEDTAGTLVDAFLGKGGNFRQIALSIISKNGLLTDAPFGFRDDEFIGE